MRKFRFSSTLIPQCFFIYLNVVRNRKHFLVYRIKCHDERLESYYKVMTVKIDTKVKVIIAVNFPILGETDKTSKDFQLTKLQENLYIHFGGIRNFRF